jgi:hypothetical protein
MTLGEAWQRYLEEKPLAPGTRRLYEYTRGKYLRVARAGVLSRSGRIAPACGACI